MGNRKILKNTDDVKPNWLGLCCLSRECWGWMRLPRGNAECLSLDMGPVCLSLAGDPQIFHEQLESHPRTTKLGRDSLQQLWSTETLTHLQCIQNKKLDNPGNKGSGSAFGCAGPTAAG